MCRCTAWVNLCYLYTYLRWPEPPDMFLRGTDLWFLGTMVLYGQKRKKVIHTQIVHGFHINHVSLFKFIFHTYLGKNYIKFTYGIGFEKMLVLGRAGLFRFRVFNTKVGRVTGGFRVNPPDNLRFRVTEHLGRARGLNPNKAHGG